MLIEKWDPFSEFDLLRDEMNRLFGASALRQRMGKEGEPATPERPWLPPVDIWEGETNVGLRIELPGLEKDDIQVSVEDGVLTVRGEKRFEKKEEGTTFRRVESRYGSFSRQFVLPENLDPEKIDAAFKNGVLTLTIGRREESLPRKVDVQIA